MLGENLMEGAWFWKAPIKETLPFVLPVGLELIIHKPWLSVQLRFPITVQQEHIRMDGLSKSV